ncbi:aspartyl-phosphate phosphatase Spo0E family protein [Paenibacillus sp. MZ04-78.2]|uniref:aspartyl-phosphate phosphatase Spo0E family protein n=1 Tax=Paenibacillus sp. MZ04-78.2 TaxID=2962034 RepID=UPI0020B8AAB9|nr:aspartyl-phosphate phosphatase Spo0E family protein [Paenibacillus sp. MZ04-78.2]
MTEINKLLANMLKEIEQLRIGLNVLSQNKASLVDPEVIEASKKLDNALNEYARLSSKWQEPPAGQD